MERFNIKSDDDSGVFIWDFKENFRYRVVLRFTGRSGGHTEKLYWLNNEWYYDKEYTHKFDTEDGKWDVMVFSEDN